MADGQQHQGVVAFIYRSRWALDPFASVHWGMDFNVPERRWPLLMFVTPEYVQSLRA